jgi:hypothetical protein
MTITQKVSREKPFNVKIVPAKMNKLSLDDLDQIKFEILHDVTFILK